MGIFVPNGFRPGEKTDFVVHFHGWRHHIETTLNEYKLIEQFSKSERNAILIVPQGPFDAADSFGGKLEDTNGFSRFISEVSDTLKKDGVISHTNIGDIILSGHSGGYAVISSIVARGGLSENVKDVFLFDALYGRTEKFANWYTQFPQRRLIDIYTLHGGTKEESEKWMDTLKTNETKIPFLSKNEADVTDADLADNHLVFIYSPLEHNEVVYKNEEFYHYLKTSRLPAINSPKPK